MNSFFQTLYKFFPYESLLNADSETLTAWWVVVTITLALYFASLLDWRCNRVAKEIRGIRNDFSPRKLSASRLLRDAWLSFSNTFLSHNGERQKTPESAEYYFNQTTILPQIINLRLYLSVPSILVGFGILGTFVGLTVGIANFKTETTEAIRESIQHLLSGMGTAFVSSVWGMFLSIIFGWYEKREFRNIDNEFDELSRVINQNFKLTKADELRFLAEDTSKVLREFFSFNMGGTDILPGSVFRDLRTYGEEQTRALKSFSTDLADGIRISTETINALGQSITLQYEHFFKVDVAPALRALITTTDRLRETKEESSAAVIERVVKNLQDSLGGMFTELRSSISDTTIKQMEILATQLGVVGSSLNEFPKAVDFMIEKLNVSMGQFQRMIEESSSTASSEAAASTSLMKEQVQESARQLAEVIGVLQTNSKSLMESQANNTQSVQNTVESSLEIILEAKELHSSYANLLSQTENAMKEIKPVTEHLIQTGAALKIGSDNLTKISNNLLQQMQNFNLSSQQTLKELQSSLEQSKITLREYADKFSIIDRGLKGIFEQIQSGLSSYQATTKESINRYLQEFTSQFVQAVKSISGATESLAENTEQLSDVFETILKKFQGK